MVNNYTQTKDEIEFKIKLNVKEVASTRFNRNKLKKSRNKNESILKTNF
jgi:hypothetical protein